MDTLYEWTLTDLINVLDGDEQLATQSFDYVKEWLNDYGWLNEKIQECMLAAVEEWQESHADWTDGQAYDNANNR